MNIGMLPCKPKVCLLHLIVIYAHKSFLLVSRIVHAFTCAGILPSQYFNFTKHSKLGKVGPYYTRSGMYVACICVV